MSEATTAIAVVQTVAIVAASVTAGIIFGLSHIAVPALYHAPTPIMLKQWATIYAIGKATGPVAALVAATAFGYLARAVPALRYSYVGAAALSITIVPWTGIMMTATNDELTNRLAAFEKLKDGEAAAEAGRPQGEKTVDLMAKWQALNYVRALFPLAGAVLAAWATLS
ncbi:hypothetical protein MMC18_005867 [Xylographa bjoerkii]|nr:hypothetical protein [Xylographa bjoerkii]